MQLDMPTSKEYEEWRKKGLKKNLENFDVNDDYVLKKMKRFVEFHPEFDLEQVKEEIKRNIMFRTFFVKDPIRENMYEELFKKTTKRIKDIVDFDKPDASYYLWEGKLLTKKLIKEKKVEAETKSMDFVCNYKGKKIWFYNKYAKEPGGHQDNQYDDLKRFMIGANKVKSKEMIFIGVADGEYFNSQDVKTDKTRIDTLRELANNETTFAIQSTELESILNQIVSL